MTKENHLYNPDWETVHDFHHECRTRLEKERKAVQLSPNKDLARLERIDVEWQYHHEACLHCLDTLQHKTVKDYWKWAFNYDEATHPVFEEHDIECPDPDSYESIEEARKALRRIREAVGKYDVLLDNRAKAGQPKGLDIFKKCGDNRIYSLWKYYPARNAYDVHKPLAIKTLVTVDDRGHEKHVCFYMDGHEERRHIPLYMANLAAAFIEEDEKNVFANTRVKETAALKQGIFSQWKQRLSPNVKTLPDYHFYIHAMPMHSFKERLYPFKVDRKSTTAEACLPYDVVPQLLLDVVRDGIDFKDMRLETGSIFQPPKTDA